MSMTSKLKVRQNDEDFWLQGMFLYESLCIVSHILNYFSKKGTKPLPYSEKPYLSDVENVKTEAEKEQEIKNAQLIARLHFEQWARQTKERFKNKQGGD